MKKIVFILIVLNLYSACSLIKRREVSDPPLAKKTITKSKNSTKVSRQGRAVWHLIMPTKLELVVTSLDKKQRENIILDKTLGQVEIDLGDWKISGFIIDGKKFEILDTSKHFVFKIKPYVASYSGSLLVQCPRVSERHSAEMKKMSFFNRFSFKSGTNLCEMVVGDEYHSVKKVWSKVMGKDAPKLEMGF